MAELQTGLRRANRVRCEDDAEIVHEKASGSGMHRQQTLVLSRAHAHRCRFSMEAQLRF